MFSKDFHAFFNAIFVFSLLFIKDITKRTIVSIKSIMLNTSNSFIIEKYLHKTKSSNQMLLHKKTAFLFKYKELFFVLTVARVIFIITVTLFNLFVATFFIFINFLFRVLALAVTHQRHPSFDNISHHPKDFYGSYLHISWTGTLFFLFLQLL